MSGVSNTDNRSLIERLSDLPKAERDEWIESLEPSEAQALLNDWKFLARPKQLPPEGDWFIWLLMTGRGFGKTRSGAQWTNRRADEGNTDRWIALISKTPGDARDDMIEGPGGLLRSGTPGNEPKYIPTKRRVEWPSGSYATIYSGAHPEQIRGFSGDTAWCDELAAWEYPQESFDMLMFGLREAKLSDPKVCITTTPKPIELLRNLVERAQDQRGVRLVTGSSYENRRNLHPRYYEEVIEPYEGTTLGQQEVMGVLLMEHPDALWSRDMIDEYRVDNAPPLKKILVAIDPAVSMTEDSDETGIIVGGLTKTGKGFTLADLSGRMGARRWALRAIDAYEEWKADGIVAEKNNGGELVRRNIWAEDSDIPVDLVHASRGKRTRAEPIATKFEQGKIHHVGMFPRLEDQLCSWIPGDDSPDRLDAYVWLWTKLFNIQHGKKVVVPGGGTRLSPNKIG